MYRLFRELSLSDMLNRNHRTLYKEINSLPEDQILKTPQTDLCAYFVDKYAISPVRIDESGIRVDSSDVQIDVTRSGWSLHNGIGTVVVTGTRISFFVPFTGDSKLLRCQPSTHTLSPPRASIGNKEMIFVYDRTSKEASKVKNEFDRDIGEFKKYLVWAANDVEKFNSGLAETVEQHINIRREKLLHDREIVADLGFPLKRSSDVQKTYATPEVRRSAAPRLPAVSGEQYQPEPALDSAGMSISCR